MEINECRIPASGRKWSPRELWIPAMIWMIALMIVKLLLFDIFICAGASWDVVTAVQSCVRIILSSFILSIPIGMFRRRWMQVVIFAAVDAALLCDSPVQVACIGWLLPEMMIETVSLPAWSYPLMSLTTLAAVAVALKYSVRTAVPMQGKVQYCSYLIGWAFIAWLMAGGW